MNDIQHIIDRQLGFYSRFNYDNVLKRLAVDSEDSFYELQNAAAVQGEVAQYSPTLACRFSEAAGYEHILAIANEEGRVAIQNTKTAKKASAIEMFDCHNNAVFDLAWMPHHMKFVTVTGDHTAYLWDVEESSPRRAQSFSYHTKSVKTVAFRPYEPSIFATGGRDGHILVWDIRANNQPSIVQKADNLLMNCHSLFTPKTPRSHCKRPRIDNQRTISVTGLVFQDDTTLISCGECDGNIKVWDLRKNYKNCKREPLPKHSIPYCGSSTKNGYTNLVIDDARVRLYASCMDNVIYCFNISTYNALPEHRYIGHHNGSYFIKTSLSPDSMYLVSGSSDNYAYIWNVKYSQPIVKLAGHGAEVTCAAWCRTGDTKIVTCSDDASHKIWRIGLEYPDPDVQLKGNAEVVPRAEVINLPQWGAVDRTPNSLKRKMNTTPNSHSAKRTRPQGNTGTKNKRCLIDILNATKETDNAELLVKRLRLDVPETDVPEIDEIKLLPAGIKRQRNSTENSPSKKKVLEPESSNDWSYFNPKPGTSFMSPTKNFETKNCKLLSPKSPKTTHMEDRIATFATPTENLPNFVLHGEAPHLTVMSPVTKKQDKPNWLTLIVREKKGKNTDIDTINSSSQSLKENIPARRNSVKTKTPQLNKNNTLLRYFSVTTEDTEIE